MSEELPALQIIRPVRLGGCRSGRCGSRAYPVDIVAYEAHRNDAPITQQVVKLLQHEVRKLHTVAHALKKPEPQVVTCVYCGQAYPPGTPTSQHDLLTEHIKMCEKHPMRAAEAQIRELKAQLASSDSIASKSLNRVTELETQVRELSRQIADYREGGDRLPED